MPVSDRCHRLVTQQPNHRLISVVYAHQPISADQDPSSSRSFRIERYIGVPHQKIAYELALLAPIEIAIDQAFVGLFTVEHPLIHVGNQVWIVAKGGDTRPQDQ